MKRTLRRSSVLKWTDELAVYAAWVMMPYLTDVWKLSFTQAATITNIWTGSSGAMQILLAFFSDFVAQKFWMVLLYTFFYNIGFGLLFLSTPPVLHDSTGTCSGYKPDCIGNAQRILFFSSLATIAVGLSGRKTSLDSFLEQNSPGRNLDVILLVLRKLIWGLLSMSTAFVPLILDITQTQLKAWSIQFGILAVLNIVATIIFLSGIHSYRKGFVENYSPLTMVARVFIASASKICQPLPDDPNQLYEIDVEHEYVLSHTHTLRFLNKAAILFSTKSKDDQKKNRWTLCGVTEVEMTKRLIRMLPICTTFVSCGLVIAIGNTYFIEQANNMDRRLGRIMIPLPFFLVLYRFVKYIVDVLSNYYRVISGPKFFWHCQYIVIVTAVLCLATAAIVERLRLSTSKHHKAGETIPMSVLILIPQFFLLAVTEGLFNWHVDYFFDISTPQYLGDYWVYFGNGIRGLGTISSILSVYLVGKFSEMVNGENWFQYSLNQSRLDFYYWTLAALLAANFLSYSLLVYIYQDPLLSSSPPPSPPPAQVMDETYYY